MLRHLFALFWILIILTSCEERENKEASAKKHGQSRLKKEITLNQEYIDSVAIDTFLLKNQYYRMHREEIHTFYGKRNYQLAWSEKGFLIPQTSMFLNIVINLDRHGLITDLDESNRINNLYKSVRQSKELTDPNVVKARKELDIFLTASFFKHAPHLWSGMVDPGKAKLEWYTEPKKITYDEKLDSILYDNDYESNPFLEHEPLHKEYKKLRSALSKYRSLQRKGGYTVVDLKHKQRLTRGDTGKSVQALQQRLIESGDLKENKNEGLFDLELKKAVENFQMRHGLKEDGIVGGKTLVMLNTPVSDRITQILINMERWRWVPEKTQKNYLIVNIPEYKLHVYEEEEEKWEMNIIVGTEATGTPVFNDEIDHIVFSPSWMVPRSIALKEILPVVKRNPSYLDKRDIEVYDGNLKKPINPDTIDWKSIEEEDLRFTFKQNPGRHNPLGRVKFMFPNHFDVYLHDTPYGHLFNTKERGFSYGCIRIEEPLKLAEYLLKSQKGWTKEKISNSMNSTEEVYVKIENPIPVYILYFTAWVDDEGVVYFREDIYKHDQKLSKILYQDNQP
ncbi:MAG: murein L,D-transpeptidase [Cytophagaceae bacterium]